MKFLSRLLLLLAAAGLLFIPVYLVGGCAAYPTAWRVISKVVEPPEAFTVGRRNPKTKQPEVWKYKDDKDYVLVARAMYSSIGKRRIYVTKAKFDKYSIGQVCTITNDDYFMDVKQLEIFVDGKSVYKNSEFRGL